MNYPKPQELGRYAIYLIIVTTIFLIGLISGMALTEINTLKQILINTISGLIVLAPWFILIFISVKMLGVAIKNAGEKLLKNIPIWIDDFYKRRMYLLRVERAVKDRP
jgi:hypothetical protein